MIEKNAECQTKLRNSVNTFMEKATNHRSEIKNIQFVFLQVTNLSAATLMQIRDLKCNISTCRHLATSKGSGVSWFIYSRK